MAILEGPVLLTGEAGVRPVKKRMVTTDSLATITTAGYMNERELPQNVSPEDMLEVFYDWDDVAKSGTYGVFAVSVSNGTITLAEHESATGVNATLPTANNSIAVFSNTTGDIKLGAGTVSNAGSLQAGSSGTAGSLVSFPSTAAKGYIELAAQNNAGDHAISLVNASFGQASSIEIPDPGAATAKFILSESSISTQSIATGLSITGNNNVQTTGGGQFLAGSSGSAGHFASFPATAASGNLSLKAINNATGDFDTIISNAAAVAQDQTITIPDSGAATANFVLTEGTNTMGAGSLVVLDHATGTEAANAVTASGNSGVITTSALTTAGGASYAITWTNTAIAASSVVMLSLMGGSSTVKNVTLEATAGAGSSTLTIYNDDAAALDGTLIIGFAVF